MTFTCPASAERSLCLFYRQYVSSVLTVPLTFPTCVITCQASYTANQSRKFAIFFTADGALSLLVSWQLEATLPAVYTSRF
jgi:hypothetical protein